MDGGSGSPRDGGASASALAAQLQELQSDYDNLVAEHEEVQAEVRAERTAAALASGSEAAVEQQLARVLSALRRYVATHRTPTHGKDADTAAGTCVAPTGFVAPRESGT